MTPTQPAMEDATPPRLPCAVIGSLEQFEEMLAGAAGTQVCVDGADTA